MKQNLRLTSEHLTTIRKTADWRKLFTELGIKKDSRKSREDDWWAKSPLKPDERTPSFHMNDRGWYCHATGQGGGAIELVQRMNPGMNCYAAGRWLLAHRVSFLVEETRDQVTSCLTPDARDRTPVASGQMPGPKSSTPCLPIGTADSELFNPPIRQDLRKRLDPHHPAFAERGIPPEVLEEIVAGYLDRPPRKKGRPDPIHPVRYQLPNERDSAQDSPSQKISLSNGMNHRLVFQIRGVRQDDESGALTPVILGHIGRATSKEQEERDGKWWTYAGFKKSLELYNLDQVVLHDDALRQAADTGQVLLVEGCFDVAKLHAAGIRNVVASFGAHLSEEQATRLELIGKTTGVRRFLIFFDRDQDGTSPHGLGALQARDLITSRGLEAQVFDWNRRFSSARRSDVTIPPEITDPCEFSVEQLRWLREKGCI